MKNINTFVDNNLVERLKHVDNLTKIVFDAIGLPQKKFHMWVVRDRRSITILTNDSILATRIRLEQQQIINYVNNNSVFVVDSVRVKMTMPEAPNRQVKHITYALSEKNSKIMASIAESIEDDELRESLLSIARQKNSSS
ncbi:MAG: hypothetical protein V3U78_08145 [Thiotrichaceae bacterium]